MAKIALITDTHWGGRGDSLAFADYIRKFYKDIFFPYLIENGITRVLHLGDIVDRRKYINYITARRLREDFIQPCYENGIDLDVIIGNHDTAFKNTNEVNAMKELYTNSNYNFTWHEEPGEIVVDGTTIAMLPWVCSGNYQESMEFLENTKAQILFGHLEIKGFEMHRGSFNDHGFGADLFSKFDVVCSGHFHHKSTRGNINYLGSPYEMTWSDFNDPRGFHIFDTDTRQLQFIQNPYRLFNKIHYSDMDKTMDEVLDVEFDMFKNTYVKVVVHQKNNPYWFDLFIDKLEKSGVIDLQVVDDHFNLNLEDDSDIVNEAEDTLTILRKVVDQLDHMNVPKKELDSFLTSLYNEALYVE
jgi:DNA repair exonuclease SbcCD nuclease subunit